MKTLDNAFDVSEEQLKALDDIWAGRIEPAKPKERVSTKQCPNCGDTHLLTFPSRNKKACVSCHTEFVWFLEEGQKPLL